MGRRVHCTSVNGGDEGGGGDGGDHDQGDPLSQLTQGGSEDRQCGKCQKIFSSIGNKNHHMAKCMPQSRKSKRKVSQVYKHFKLNNSDELIQLFKQIPCHYLRFKLASATSTYVPNCYPGVFNVSTKLSPKKAKIDQVCLILADATSHDRGEGEEGIRIPKYFGML